MRQTVQTFSIRFLTGTVFAGATGVTPTAYGRHPALSELNASIFRNTAQGSEVHGLRCAVAFRQPKAASDTLSGAVRRCVTMHLQLKVVQVLGSSE